MKKLIMLFTLMLCSSLVSADIGDNFFSIKLGSSDTNDAGITSFTDQYGSSTTTTNNDLEDSGIFSVSVGKYFGESIRGEIGISQRNDFKYNVIVSDATQKYTADVESLAVFLNSYLDSQP